MSRTDYERAIADAARRRDIRREELILAVTEAIVEAMIEAKVTGAELAARLGKTPGHVSQILTGRNVTIGTLSDFADALGARVDVRIGSAKARGALVPAVKSLSAAADTFYRRRESQSRAATLAAARSGKRTKARSTRSPRDDG